MDGLQVLRSTSWDWHPLGAAISYFDEGHRAIKGYLTQAAAYALLTLLEVQSHDGVRGPIAEIGTYHGRSLVGFGLALRADERLVGVDLFTEAGQDFEAATRANCAVHGLDTGRLVLHRGESREIGPRAWATLLGLPARLVHIDGGHEFTHVLHDLELAASSLSPQGVIVADDVLHPWYPDITLAVAELLGRHRGLRAVALVDRQGSLHEGGAKLVIAAEADAERYRSAMMDSFALNRVGRTTFAGSDIAVLWFESVPRKALLRLP